MTNHPNRGNTIINVYKYKLLDHWSGGGREVTRWSFTPQEATVTEGGAGIVASTSTSATTPYKLRVPKNSRLYEAGDGEWYLDVGAEEPLTAHQAVKRYFVKAA